MKAKVKSSEKKQKPIPSDIKECSRISFPWKSEYSVIVDSLSINEEETILQDIVKYNIMQLPRGTFLSIKRSVRVGDLLAELQDMKFTGICSISFGLFIGTIVFKSGKRILAEYKETVGDTAGDELQKINGEKVDASLSTLNEAQIQLSLEFNKACLIVKGAKADPAIHPKTPAPNQHTIKKPLMDTPKQAHIGTSKNHQTPGIPEASAAKIPLKVEPVRASELPKIISDAHLKKAAQKPFAAVQQKSPVFPEISEEKNPENTAVLQTDADFSSFEKDIETFETMDVEIITNKIRGECKTLIKQLHLEHLTED